MDDDKVACCDHCKRDLIEVDNGSGGPPLGKRVNEC